MYYRFCLALHRQPVKTVSMFEQYSLDTKKTGDALQKEMAEWSISEKTLGQFKNTFLKYNEKSIFLLVQILTKTLQFFLQL